MRYNFLKLGNYRNTEWDTTTDTNRKTCEQKSPLGSGFINTPESDSA